MAMLESGHILTSNEHDTTLRTGPKYKSIIRIKESKFRHTDCVVKTGREEAAHCSCSVSVPREKSPLEGGWQVAVLVVTDVLQATKRIFFVVSYHNSE